MNRFNSNWVALGLLGAGYLYSVYYVSSISVLPTQQRSDQTVHLIHWQLEPGYREGLQWAIDQYNALPHVREQGVRIQQQGVTEKVYGQFLNIHMISGTGPDIAQKGKSQLIRGNAVARFFEPLSDYVTQPNPYNQPEYLPEDVSPEMAELLADSPWKDTFIDGMRGGFDVQLNDYFAVPVSTFGGLRLFYNMDLVAEAKAYVREQLGVTPRPAWLQRAIKPDQAAPGFLPDDERLRAWLGSPQPPETYGQLLLLCEAIMVLADQTGRDNLVSISGSSYAPNDIGLMTYQRLFLTELGAKLDRDLAGSVTPLELVAGWQDGLWSLDDPAIRSAFDMMRLMATYYPPGYLGLDREQAQRRFVQGNAMIMGTGGWDAASIYRAIAGDDGRERFELRIDLPPVAAEGEIWSEYLVQRASEAEFSGGVPFALNKQSAHPEVVLDFLRFITSARINQGLNRRAGWLPVIIGTEPLDNMRPFTPDVEGVPPNLWLNLGSSDLMAQIRNAVMGNRKLVITGEMSFDEFAEIYRRSLEDPRLGADRQWFEIWQAKNDRTASQDQSLNVELVRRYLLEDPTAADRRRSRLYDTIYDDRGYRVRDWWNKLNPDEPFPSK